MRDNLLIIIVIFSSLIALRRPTFGMLTYILFSFVNPNSMTWGIGRAFPSAQFLAIGTLIGFFLWTESKKFPNVKELKILLLLWVLFAFTSVFALDIEEAYKSFINISKVILMVFLSTAIINNRERFHNLMRIYGLSIGFFGMKSGIFFIATGGEQMIWGPEQSYLAANNSIGLAMAMNVPLLFYLSKFESNIWLRWLMRVMLLFSYPAIVGTYSRGAWLGLAIASLFIVLKSRFKILVIPACVLLIIIISPFMPERAEERFQDLVEYQEESSAQARFWSWEYAYRVAKSHPVLGAGFNHYNMENYQKGWFYLRLL